jgi:putative membrane protein
MKKLVPTLILSSALFALPAFANMDDDRDFGDAELASKIHEINLHEIDAGTMAETKAQSKDVKDYAKSLVKQHRDFDKKLTELAAKKGWTLTATPKAEPSEHEKTMTSETGVAFDRSYLTMMQKGHNDAILLLSCQAFTHPIDKDLKKEIDGALSTLEKHRTKSIELLKDLTDKTPTAS